MTIRRIAYGFRIHFCNVITNYLKWHLHRLLLFIISILSTKFIQPPFIKRATAILIRNDSWLTHLIELAILRTIAERFKFILLLHTPVIFNRNISHASPLALKAFTTPALLVQHPAPTPIINSQLRNLRNPRRTIPSWSPHYSPEASSTLLYDNNLHTPTPDMFLSSRYLLSHRQYEIYTSPAVFLKLQ